MKNVILSIFCLWATANSCVRAQSAPERTLFFCCSPSGFCSDVGFELITECQGSCRDFSRCQARSIQSVPVIAAPSQECLFSQQLFQWLLREYQLSTRTIAPVTQSLVPQSTILETSIGNPGIAPFAAVVPTQVIAPLGRSNALAAPVQINSALVNRPVSNFVTATTDSGPLRTGAPTPGVR
ncbi:hypothetical protein H0X48_03850 [Candidatus Dependentiae bacterium]|nr:hypothetical protein [Candidatus Dependentiae bacterium]